MITIDLPLEIEASFQKLAKAKGFTAVDYLKELILCAIEDAEDVADAEAVLADIKTGRQHTISHEELVKKYFSGP